MKELLELLDVTASESTDSCIVLEQCSTYDAVLSEYYIVCHEYNVPGIEDWIRNNIRSSVDHCIKMFGKKPESIMKFIVASQNAKSLTEEIVKACGGVQGFLDKYAKAPEPETADSPEAETDVIKRIDAFGDDGEELSEGTEYPAEDLANTVEFEAETGDEPHPAAGSREALAEALALTDIAWAVPAEAESELKGEQPASPDSQEELEEVVAVTKPLTADEQLQQMLELQRKEDAKRSGLIPEEQEEEQGEEEKEEKEEVAAETQGKRVLDSKTRKALADSLFTDTGEFAGFTEDQTIAVMKMLKTIDSTINLDGLEPGNILSKEEMQESKGIIESFAPGVFKSFVLYAMENASTDYELIRTTVMLDDFCNFVNKEFGGK